MAQEKKSEELRGLAPDELKRFVFERKEELMRLRFQKATGQLENTSRISAAKREIARAKGIETERAEAAYLDALLKSERATA